MHFFCLLARVRQLFSFLLVQLWTLTWSMCAQHFHVPSVCYSKRWFVQTPLPGLFSTSPDPVTSTLQHLSSVSPSNTHFPLFFSALLAGVFTGSWPLPWLLAPPMAPGPSHGWFIVPMGMLLFHVSWLLPVSNVYSMQFHNLFRTF